jgi:hypothetical protein
LTAQSFILNFQDNLHAAEIGTKGLECSKKET